MITIPGLDSVTDILDTDQVMVTNAAGQSYKISGSELNKRNKIIIANGTTVTGAPLKTGNCVRIYFTAALSANDANTVLQLNYNNVTYNVKVPKDGALQNYVAFEVSSGVFKYLQAYTTLELLFDGTQFVIIGNPVVISNSDYVITVEGSITQKQATINVVQNVNNNIKVTVRQCGKVVTISAFCGGLTYDAASDTDILVGLPAPKTIDVNVFDFVGSYWLTKTTLNLYVSSEGVLRSREGITSGLMFYFSVTYLAQ